MKKTILLLGTLFFLGEIYCQINIKNQKDLEETLIGEVKPMGAFMAECKRYISANHDTAYVVLFKNAKYTSITDIQGFSFNETGGDFIKLYKIIDENFKAKEKKEIEIPLKDGTLTLSFEKQVGALFLRFQWYEKTVLSYSGLLSFNQVKKLFGNPE